MFDVPRAQRDAHTRRQARAGTHRPTRAHTRTHTQTRTDTHAALNPTPAHLLGAPKHVNYEQIDWVIRYFQSKGHKVLLVLHQRHLFEQTLPARYAHITKKVSGCR